jgi:hypothetical protein
MAERKLFSRLFPETYVIPTVRTSSLRLRWNLARHEISVVTNPARTRSFTFDTQES